MRVLPVSLDFRFGLGLGFEIESEFGFEFEFEFEFGLGLGLGLGIDFEVDVVSASEWEVFEREYRSSERVNEESLSRLTGLIMDDEQQRQESIFHHSTWPKEWRCFLQSGGRVPYLPGCSATVSGENLD